MEKLEKRISRLVSRLRNVRKSRRNSTKNCEMVTSVYSPSRRSTSSEIRPLSLQCGLDDEDNKDYIESTNQKLMELSQKAMVRMIELGQKSNLQVSKKNPLGTLPLKLKKKLTREKNELDAISDHLDLPLPVLVKEHETIEITIDIHDSYMEEPISIHENETMEISSIVELQQIGSIFSRLESDDDVDDSLIRKYVDDNDEPDNATEQEKITTDFLEVQYMRSEIDSMPMIDDFQELDQPSFRSDASAEKETLLLSPVVTNTLSSSELDIPSCAKSTFTHVPMDGVPVSMACSESTNFSSLQNSTISCSTEKDINEETISIASTTKLGDGTCENYERIVDESDDVSDDVVTVRDEEKSEKALSETSTNRTSSIELDEVDDSISSAPLPRLKIEDEEERRYVESRESGYISSLSMGSPINSHSYSIQNLHHLSPKVPRATRYRQTHEEGFRMHGLQRATTTENLSAVRRKEDSMFDDFMKDTVYKTKYITSIFEVKNGGMEDVVDDILWEISKNISTNKMLVAACELHFSVPVDRRNRKTEYRLKTGLLSTLRINNQRLLNLKRGNRPAPLHLFESNTDENIRLNKDVQATQGIYLRVYKRLIEYAHKETTELHRPYWQLAGGGVGIDHETLSPQPQRFLFDDDQKMDNLTNDTLVAVNIIALAFLGLN